MGWEEGEDLKKTGQARGRGGGRQRLLLSSAWSSVVGGKGSEQQLRGKGLRKKRGGEKKRKQRT
jgi:hypothetical protein